MRSMPEIRYRLFMQGGEYIGKYRKPYAGIHSGSGNA